MKSLENKTYDSKREMDILDNLEEVRHLNKRHANVDHQKMIENSRKLCMQSLQEDVLKKDSKEIFSKLRRKREEMMLQDAIKEKENAEKDDESDDEDLVGIGNINKRELKAMIKPNPLKNTLKSGFKSPMMKLKKKVKTDEVVVSARVNPLDMLAGSDSDSEED